MSLLLHAPKRLLAAVVLTGILAFAVQSKSTDVGQVRGTGQPAARSAGTAASSPLPADAEPGRALYQRWCESCHGPEGDGTGRGARYVYPPPRNLRAGQFSLVTSANRIASRDDIYRVLRDGMPGTAMTAFDKLREDELQALVDEVCRLREAGARAKYAADCAGAGEPLDEQACREFVNSQTTASEMLAVPPFTVGDKNAAVRGRAVFSKQSCNACHGQDGIGAPETILEDNAGNVLRARDLVREPFKGGTLPASIYRRIRLGFPSGPMPAHASLTEQETADLVNYVISVSRQPKRVLTNHQLRRYATRALYINEFGPRSEP